MTNFSGPGELWDDPAKDYRQRYELPDQFIWDYASQARITWDGYMSIVLSLLPPPPAKVLDVGCGPGMSTRLLTSRGYTAQGIDYNARGIAFARLLVPDVPFEVSDIRELATAAELHDCFDAAIHVEVFEHIPPQYHPQVLQGICSTLHKGGIMVLSVPSSNIPLNKWDYRHFSLEEITTLVESNGFAVRKVIYQDRISPLFSPLFGKLLSNKIYDLRAARQVMRRIYLKWFNTTLNPKQAGRFILQTEKLV